jgi:hypothetical protein
MKSTYLTPKKAGSESTEELTVCSPQAKIPATIDRSKFLNCDEFTSNGNYKILAANITYDEFNVFILENLEFPSKFTYFKKKILVPLYQYGNESSIHETTVSKINGMIESYCSIHDDIAFGSAQRFQDVGSFSRQPDFAISAMTRYRHSISNSNIVGEVMYSQNLMDGHQINDSTIFST